MARDVQHPTPSEQTPPKGCSRAEGREGDVKSSPEDRLSDTRTRSAVRPANPLPARVKLNANARDRSRGAFAFVISPAGLDPRPGGDCGMYASGDSPVPLRVTVAAPAALSVAARPRLGNLGVKSTPRRRPALCCLAAGDPCCTAAQP